MVRRHRPDRYGDAAAEADELYTFVQAALLSNRTNLASNLRGITPQIFASFSRTSYQSHPVNLQPAARIAWFACLAVYVIGLITMAYLRTRTRFHPAMIVTPTPPNHM